MRLLGAILVGAVLGILAAVGVTIILGIPILIMAETMGRSGDERAGGAMFVAFVLWPLVTGLCTLAGAILGYRNYIRKNPPLRQPQ